MIFLASATDYSITLNIQDFLWGLLILSLVILVFFIILMIAKVIQNLSTAHKILKLNKDYIDKIIKNAASISENADSISGDVSHISSSLLPTVDNITDTTESITKTFKENNPINEIITKVYKTLNNVNKVVSAVKNKQDKKADKKCCKNSEEE